MNVWLTEIGVEVDRESIIPDVVYACPVYIFDRT